MSEVINRGSCPQPENRPGAIMAITVSQGERLMKALEELEAAKSLLAAIAELVELPRPAVDDEPDYQEYKERLHQWANAQKDRTIYIAVAARCSDHRIGEKILRDGAHRQDLGYRPKEPAS